MVLPSVEANPMDTVNASEPWARLSLGSVQLIRCAELLLGDNITLS